MGIAGGDFQGAVGVEGNVGLVFRNFHGSVVSTACGVPPNHVWAVSNGHRLIQVLMDGHGLAGQRVSPAVCAIKSAHGSGTVLDDITCANSTTARSA